LKKRIENIGSLIERWCKKKIVFACPLLPFGTVREAYAHCTHAKEKLARVQFLPSRDALLKVSAILILLFTSFSSYSQDSYIATVDLNLRSGAGKNYKSITVLATGDTVKLLESSGDYWAKIQYQDKIGYSAKQYLQKIEIKEKIGAKAEEKAENSNGFITFLFFSIILIVIAVVLKNSGDKYRHKSTATILSFFFGAFGFQKFYLGEKNKGIFSILFCWTFIPSIVGLIDFIKLAVMNEIKFNDLYNCGKIQCVKPEKTIDTPKPKNNLNPKVQIQREIYSNQVEESFVDESIIDVNTQNLDLSVEQNVEIDKSYKEPPYWGHTYVYSCDELKYANKKQKQFYSYFKNKVVNGEYVDIQGNTNYAFILYFDFLNEYDKHRNVKLLEEQLKLLGEICPKIRNYSLYELKSILEQRNDSYSVEKLEELNDERYCFENGYSDFDPDAGKLGRKYGEILKLSDKEIDWLNKFYFQENIFTSIENCLIYTIKQYCNVLLKLETKLATDNLTEYIEKEIKENLIRKSDYFPSFEADVYLLIFKNVENSIRESCQHTRKLTTDTLNYYSSRVQSNFDKHLGILVSEIIESIKLYELNLETQTLIELNAHNTARWRKQFLRLKEALKKGDKESFINGVESLEIENKKNPNIENILFEASKIVARYDNILSLKYYAKYIYYDLKSKKFDNKELTKTVQKSLFKTEDQINDFKEIIADLIATNNIQTALEKISKIYIPKRKRIQLNRSEIQEVEQKHEGTVELLNEYLVDEKEKAETEISIENGEDIEIEIIPSVENNSVFISEINMGQVQEELVKIIIQNSYEIHQDEVDKYAIENGMFKNQLIDNINEVCGEHLDGEALIEEDDENYIIEESYYKEIAK